MAQLLSRKSPDTIYYIRAILNIIYMADYTFYINETLRYMEHTLMQIDKTKEAFWDTHCTNAQICDNEPKNFNFSK